jgi:hypothetical protein
MPYGTVNADVIQTSTSGGILGAGNASIMKNRIINGAMVIDQRNAGASVAGNGVYTLDRWYAQASANGKYTVQQNAGSVTPPVGFSNYLGVTSSSAYSVSGGENFSLLQGIEGYNIADLNWGSANAKTITISFWVRSSLTGTFGGSLQNSAQNRSYPFTYTISSANTWEYETITITGDTSGTWLTTNGAGIYMWIGLGVGSTASGTAGSWSGSNYTGATGATSVVGTNGATFYITGVQLEVGSSATGFEYRQYTTELQLCQRYYEKTYNISVVPGTVTEVGLFGTGGVQGAVTTSEVSAGTSTFKVQKRTTPTIALWDSQGNSGKCGRLSAGVAWSYNSNASVPFIGEQNLWVNSSSGGSAGGCFVHYTASAEL